MVFSRIFNQILKYILSLKIDFTQPFVWLDDYVFQSEMDILHENRTEDSLILINLDSPNELRNLMVSLQV